MLKQLLFVCVENSCRSQMAEAFAKRHANGKLTSHSAGSKPSGQINPRAIQAMSEIGYDLNRHHSKSLNDIPQINYDVVVTMGCGDSCPDVSANNRQDWAIPDPKQMNQIEFNQIRDLIETEVINLINSINP